MPNDWHLVSRNPQDDASGFEASAFGNAGTLLDSTEIVISYAGTYNNPPITLFNPDRQASAALALGFISEQLKQAADYYLTVKAAAPAGAKISLTGHSLGGGLAALVAVMFGESATTFDQAPFLQSARLFAATDILGNVTVTGVARSLRDHLAAYATDAQMSKLDAYIAANNPANSEVVAADTLAVRSTAVANLNVQGEFLSGLPWSVLDRIGTTIRNLEHGGVSVSGDDLHAQSLLTTFVHNDGFRQVTFTLTDLLPMIFDENLYEHDTDPESDKVNLLEHLLRHEVGGVGGIPEGGNAMLTRFTADLQKLAATDGLSISGSDLTQALIAFAMQAYYEGRIATEVSKELYEAISGGIRFERSDISDDPDLNQIKGHVQYFKNHLATLPAAEQAIIHQHLPNLLDWYLAGTRLSATAGEQSAFMLGAGQADHLYGGTGDDLLVGLGGNDTLIGGAGADRVEGGDGGRNHIRHITKVGAGGTAANDRAWRVAA